MIINKIYEVNMKDCDSVILQLADDIKAGYEIQKLEWLEPHVTARYYDNEPRYAIHLHLKRADFK